MAIVLDIPFGGKPQISVPKNSQLQNSQLQNSLQAPIPGPNFSRFPISGRAEDTGYVATPIPKRVMYCTYIYIDIMIYI